MAEINSFADLSKMKYKDQAIWFMNGFWDSDLNSDEANKIWNFQRKFVELDLLGPERKGENGNELDQFWSAKFLEDMDAAMTATQRKEALRTIDQDSNGKMSCIEYLVWKYKKGVQETLEAPQGGNEQELKAAQKKMEEVQTAIADVTSKLESQKAAQKAQEEALRANNEKLEEQKQRVAEAEAAHAEVKKAEEAVKAAEAELEAAVNELNQQEENYKKKLADLEAKSNDPNGSVVSRNKASNELAQLKEEDPLPLRKAKITQEAALRKVQKERKAAEEKTAEAQAKKDALAEVQRQLEETQKELERTKMELDEAVAQLEAAYAELEAKMAEAAAELEEAKKKGGSPKGALWWMQRELFEADKRLPKAKQKFDHNKPFAYDP